MGVWHTYNKIIINKAEPCLWGSCVHIVETIKEEVLAVPAETCEFHSQIEPGD